jgi:hypothetical protein
MAASMPSNPTVCAVNTDPAEAPLFRVPTAPNQRNGLDARRFDA